MGGIQPLLMALLVIASVGAVPGTVVAEDEWADNCQNANIIDQNSISGQIDHPTDSDYFRLEVTEGNYLTISGIFPSAAATPQVRQTYRQGEAVVANPKELQGVTIEGGIQFSPGLEGSFQWWPSETGTMCVYIRDRGEAEVPYQWRLNIVRNSPEPAGFEVTELQDRISELESQLQQKNQRISELESQVENLRSRSSGGGSGNVTIQVTVTPASGQQNFVEGGEAVVQAESEKADVSQMSVEYGSGTYQLDSSGQVAIPLAQTGTQEMTLVNGDTTKQVSIEVQAQEGQNQQNQQDTTPTGTSGPGFGLVVALMAILGSGFLLQRHRES